MEFAVSKEKNKERLTYNQKISLRTLEKHLLLLRLEEHLILITFVTGGILGRILLQGLPSVEPITFFAVLAGSLFGKRRGAISGATAWYLSNFFMFGGQGPWTFVHILSGAFAGYLGGFLEKKGGYIKTVAIMVSATLFFELIMNISSGFFFGFGMFISFISAAPFIIAHLFSNIGFSFLLPKAKKTVMETGKLNEKKLCKEYIEKIKLIKISQNEL